MPALCDGRRAGRPCRGIDRAIRHAQVSRRLHAFRLCEPRCAQGRHADLVELWLGFRQAQSDEPARRRGAARRRAHVRDVDHQQQRRTEQRLRTARRRYAHRARRHVGDVSPEPGRTLLERRQDHRGRRPVFIRHAARQARQSGVSRRVPGHHAARRARPRDRAVHVPAAQRRSALSGGRPAGVLAEMGAAARRHARRLRQARLRAADRKRSLPDRAIQPRPRHQLQAQSGLLGQGLAEPARHVQLRPDRAQVLRRRRCAARGLQGRRIRRDHGESRAQLGARLYRPAVRRRRDRQAGSSPSTTARTSRASI